MLLFTEKKRKVEVSDDNLITMDECKCYVGKSDGPEILWMSL